MPVFPATPTSFGGTPYRTVDGRKSNPMHARAGLHVHPAPQISMLVQRLAPNRGFDLFRSVRRGSKCGGDNIEIGGRGGPSVVAGFEFFVHRLPYARDQWVDIILPIRPHAPKRSIMPRHQGAPKLQLCCQFLGVGKTPKVVPLTQTMLYGCQQVLYRRQRLAWAPP